MALLNEVRSIAFRFSAADDQRLAEGAAIKFYDLC